MTTLRSVSLIGAPTDIGAGARGASMGPEALRVADLAAALQSHGVDVLDRGNLSGPSNPWLPPVDGYRHLNEVTTWNQTVHDAVYAELKTGRMPILLGGDHCLGRAPSAPWLATAAMSARSCACSGWTPMPTSTPAPSPRRAISTACPWPACAASARSN